MKNIPTLNFTDENDFSIDRYKEIMESHGTFIALFNKPIDLLKLINKVGNPHSHNNNQDYVWDIRPIKGSEYNLVRSLTDEEFEFHTDCSFEDPTPKYMALYVIENDKLGGGESMFIDYNDVYPLLDEKTKKVLKTNYPMVIPAEFRKNTDTIMAPILLEDGLRYRRECVIDSKCSKEQLDAINKLNDLILNRVKSLKMNLPKGAVLFMDNRRFLHARTKIKDKSRHLQRIRYF